MQQNVTFIEKDSQFGNNKNYRKVRDHCHFTGNIEVQHIVYVI